MIKGILISAMLILMNVPKMNSQTSMPGNSEMKIRDLVILVKYAQGAVVFNSFFDYLKFMKPAERKVFLSQIIELTGHFAIDDSAADLVIRKSGISDTCAACLILKEGIYEAQLQKITELPESELAPSFKLLLTLFSIGYQEGYRKHKNAPTKFWYWDYSEEENALKVVELPYDQYIHIEEVLIP